MSRPDMQLQRAWRPGAFVLPEGDVLGDMPGLHPPGHPGELGATRRIAADAVAAIAGTCRLPAYGAVAMLARRLAVRKALVRQFTQEGVAVPGLRSAILDATEEIERRAGGPWSGHVPVTLRRVVGVY